MLTTQDKRFENYLKMLPRIMQEQQEDDKRKIRPYNPFHEVMPDGTWRGERCFIIAGGPSLKGFDFECLRGQGRIIAINKALEYVPFADILFFMDHDNFYLPILKGRFGQKIIESWKSFKGYKVHLNLKGKKLEDVYSIRSLGQTGFSPSIKYGLYHGNNSGVGAIGLAVCLGANPIYLLGIDCKLDADGNSHFHEGYGPKVTRGIVASFIRHFETLHNFLDRTNFSVVNLNPQSALRCFPFSTIEEALGNGKI